MSLLSMIGISDAVASTTQAAHPSATGGLLSMLPMLLIFVFAIYFLMIRPQSRRAKEHKKLMEGITSGDEVVTTGGMMGTVSKILDGFVVINIAKGVDITMQKNAIASVLPKGTLDSMQ